MWEEQILAQVIEKVQTACSYILEKNIAFKVDIIKIA